MIRRRFPPKLARADTRAGLVRGPAFHGGRGRGRVERGVREELLGMSSLGQVLLRQSSMVPLMGMIILFLLWVDQGEPEGRWVQS